MKDYSYLINNYRKKYLNSYGKRHKKCTTQDYSILNTNSVLLNKMKIIMRDKTLI